MNNEFTITICKVNNGYIAEVVKQNIIYVGHDIDDCMAAYLSQIKDHIGRMLTCPQDKCDFTFKIDTHKEDEE